MEAFIIFITGLIILIGAILLNALAHKLKLKTWYEFVKQRRDTSVVSYVWLYVLYPGALGLLAYWSFVLFGLVE
jgi:hypothetical protein